MLEGETSGVLPFSVSPDRQSVLRNMNADMSAPEQSLLVVSLSGAPSKPFLTSAFRKSAGAFSPDGRWIAYISNDSGRLELYVTACPGPGAAIPVSSEGASNLRWSRDGRELFYRNGGKMMAVKVDLTPTFRAGRPELLFEAKDGYSSNYDVAPDGKRFLMIKNLAVANAGQANQLNVVVNWIEELNARVPSK